LTDDGLTQWHPAFLALAASLELCATAYRKFCQKYKPQPKPEKQNHWGSKLLAKIRARGKPSKKVSPGQRSLWEAWDMPESEIVQVAEKFVQANQYPQTPQPEYPVGANRIRPPGSSTTNEKSSPGNKYSRKDKPPL
jgi:putative transposase